MTRKYLLMSLASFSMMVLGIVAGISLLVHGTYFYYSEIANEDDFLYDSNWQDDHSEYTSYRCVLDNNNLGTDLSINVESKLDHDIEVAVTVYYGDDEAWTSEETPFEMDRYVGTVDEVEIYVDIEEGYDIGAVSISVETNNAYFEVCFGWGMSVSCLGLGLPIGIVLMVLHIKSKKLESVDRRYEKEIKDLERKIRGMEKLGINTSKERKLLEKYKGQ